MAADRVLAAKEAAGQAFVDHGNGGFLVPLRVEVAPLNEGDADGLEVTRTDQKPIGGLLGGRAVGVLVVISIAREAKRHDIDIAHGADAGERGDPLLELTEESPAPLL